LNVATVAKAGQIVEAFRNQKAGTNLNVEIERKGSNNLFDNTKEAGK
jgi:hypothetical protein